MVMLARSVPLMEVEDADVFVAVVVEVVDLAVIEFVVDIMRLAVGRFGVEVEPTDPPRRETLAAMVEATPKTMTVIKSTSSLTI